jgi:hypothetical protein
VHFAWCRISTVNQMDIHKYGWSHTFICLGLARGCSAFICFCEMFSRRWRAYPSGSALLTVMVASSLASRVETLVAGERCSMVSSLPWPPFVWLDKLLDEGSAATGTIVCSAAWPWRVAKDGIRGKYQGCGNLILTLWIGRHYARESYDNWR